MYSQMFSLSNAHLQLSQFRISIPNGLTRRSHEVPTVQDRPSRSLLYSSGSYTPCDYTLHPSLLSLYTWDIPETKTNNQITRKGCSHPATKKKMTHSSLSLCCPSHSYKPCNGHSYNVHVFIHYPMHLFFSFFLCVCSKGPGQSQQNFY